MSEVFYVKTLGGGDGVDGLNGSMRTSFERDFRIVVFPALSRPSTRMRSYAILFLRKLRRIPISPPA